MPLNPVIEAWIGARDQAVRMFEDMQDRVLKQKQLEQQDQQFQQEQKIAQQRLQQTADIAGKQLALDKAIQSLKISEAGAKGLVPGRNVYDVSPEGIQALVAGGNPQVIGQETEQEYPGLGRVRFNAPEEAGKLAAQFAAPTLRLKFGEQQFLEDLKQRGRLNLENLRTGARKELQDDQQAFLADQWEKNRKAAMGRASLRASATLRGAEALKFPAQVTVIERMGENFRKDPTVRSFEQIGAAEKAFEEIMKNPSGVSDTALITLFAKVNDSLSTMNAVKEAEFENAKNSQAIKDRIAMLFQRVSSGKMVAKKAIGQMLQVTKDFRVALEPVVGKKTLGAASRARAAGIKKELIEAQFYPDRYLLNNPDPGDLEDVK